MTLSWQEGRIVREFKGLVYRVLCFEFFSERQRSPLLEEMMLFMVIDRDKRSILCGGSLRVSHLQLTPNRTKYSRESTEKIQ